MGIIGGGLINPSNQGSSSSSSSQLALSDGLACYTASFSGVSTTQFSHGLGSTNLVIEFKDSGGNLLIPDTWSIINSNVIEAEFSPAATGDVTIIACIESGLAPVTGGVTTIEGLSGIVDLDSPNGSIVISTSGQVINLNAIFTPASGAVLEQKCRDIDTLSGMIGGGGGGTPDAGQTSINGLSGQLQLTSPDGSILVGDGDQAIELSGLFTQASGAVLQQKCDDIDTLSGLNRVEKATFDFTPTSGNAFVLEHGLLTTDFTFTMWSTATTPPRLMTPNNLYASVVNHVVVVLDVPTSGKVVLVG